MDKMDELAQLMRDADIRPVVVNSAGIKFATEVNQSDCQGFLLHDGKLIWQGEIDERIVRFFDGVLKLKEGR